MGEYSTNPANFKQFMTHLPSWVKFPDVEKTEWFNTVVAALWPSIAITLENQIKEKRYLEEEVGPKVKFLKFIRPRSIHLGDNPPEILGSESYAPNKLINEVVVDAEVSFVSKNENIIIEMGKGPFTFTAVIKDIRVRGTLRLILSDFVEKWPCFSLLKISFTEKPDIELDLQLGGINTAAVPGLASMMGNAIRKGIEKKLVWPNEIRKGIRRNLDGEKETGPTPKGILFVRITDFELRKRNIEAVFNHRGRTANVKVNKAAARMKHMEFVIENTTLDVINVEIGNLGNVNLNLSEMDVPDEPDILEKEIWLEIDKFNKICLHCVWEPVGLGNEVDSTDACPTEGVLSMQILHGRNLAAMDKWRSSDPYVKVKMNEQKVSTQMIKNNCNPAWDEKHVMFVDDETRDVARFEVFDYDKLSSNDSLGFLNIPMSDIITAGGKLEGTYTLEDQPRRAKGTVKVQLSYWRRFNPFHLRRVLGGESYDNIREPAIRMIRQNSHLSAGEYSDAEDDTSSCTISKSSAKGISSSMNPIPELTESASPLDPLSGTIPPGMLAKKKISLGVQKSQSPSGSPPKGHVMKPKAARQKSEGTSFFPGYTKHQLGDGLLKVKLIAGHDLIEKNGSKHSSNPMAILKVGKDVRYPHTKTKSSVIKNCLNPVWTEVFEFQIKDVKSENLRIEIWNRNRWTRNDFMGAVDIELQEIVDEGGRILNEWDLDDVDQGSVKLELNFQPDFSVRRRSTSAAVQPPGARLSTGHLETRPRSVTQG